MRIATIDGHGAAIQIGNEWLSLAVAGAGRNEKDAVPTTVRGLISDWERSQPLLAARVEQLAVADDLKEQLRRQGALLSAGEARLLAPLPDPGTIFATGMNYTDHLDEMNAPKPDSPYMFVKANSAIIGPDTAIIAPRDHGAMVDWEAELAVIIGRSCYRVSEAEALAHVFGYTAANDVSARNWAGTALSVAGGMPTVIEWGRNIMGKQFPTFCPLGPSIVTSEDITDPQTLAISLRVNGETMQASHTSKMVFSVSAMVSYYSHFCRLEPGDILLTGTMGGVGFGRNPQCFLRDGDRVEVEIEKIGTLANSFVN